MSAKKSKKTGKKEVLDVLAVETAGRASACPERSRRRARSKFAERKAEEANDGMVKHEVGGVGRNKWGQVLVGTPEGFGWTTGWDAVLGMALAAMDEEGVERLGKLRMSAERLRKANPRAGEGIDVKAVQKALAAWYDAKCGFGKSATMGQVFGVCGARMSDYFGGVNAFPEFRVVYDYVSGMAEDVRRQKAWEHGDMALEAQERLLTEEGCEINQKAVEVGLKGAMKDVYGEDSRRGGIGRNEQRGGITYNFPNMQIAWISAPGAKLDAGNMGKITVDAARDAAEVARLAVESAVESAIGGGGIVMDSGGRGAMDGGVMDGGMGAGDVIDVGGEGGMG